MTRMTKPLSTVVLLRVSIARATADVGLLRTSEPLDDARGYCLTFACFGPTVSSRRSAPGPHLQYGGQLDDQRFERLATRRQSCRVYDSPGRNRLHPWPLVVRACSLRPTALDDHRGHLIAESARDLCVSSPAPRASLHATLVSPSIGARCYPGRCDDTHGAATFPVSPAGELGSAAPTSRTGRPTDVAGASRRVRHRLYADRRPDPKIYASQPSVYEAVK